MPIIDPIDLLDARLAGEPRITIQDAEIAYRKAIGSITGADERCMAMAKAHFEMHSRWVKYSLRPKRDVEAMESVLKMHTDLLIAMGRLDDNGRFQEQIHVEKAVQFACNSLRNAL